MSRLEQATQPILEPMILGEVPQEGMVLSDAEIRTLGTWVTKQALISYRVSNSPPLDEWIYHEFYRRQEPFSEGRVWLASHVPTWGELISVSPVPMHKEGLNAPATHMLFTIVVGYAVLQLMLDVRQADRSLPVGRPEPSDIYFQILPTAHRRIWPPKYAMKADLLEFWRTNGAKRPSTLPVLETPGSSSLP